MTFDYQVILGIIAAIVGLVGYFYYYRDVFRGTTTPHPFSWFSFGLLTGISFFAQVVKNAGPGAWVTGISSLATLGITVLSLKKGEKRITFFDWICFAGALLGVALWQLTQDPLTAVVVVTITDFVAFAPTYRKGYFRPYSETLANYVASSLKYVIGLAALTSFNWTTALYPTSLVISNAIFIAVLLYRRSKISSQI